jgi:hypothetical protein
VENWEIRLVAGAGFEPVTSGLRALWIEYRYVFLTRSDNG